MSSSASNPLLLPGHEGARAGELLRAAHTEGVRQLSDLARGAITRLVESGDHHATHLFDDSERTDLAEALGKVVSTADLLGRVRVREQLTRAAKGVRSFSEGPPAFHRFAEPIPLTAPVEALKYFQRLEPLLGVDPHRFGPQMERQAFTLAKATEETLLDRIQQLLAGALQSGEVPQAKDRLDDILDRAGVGSDPSYAEMVVRTNAADAYNTGAWDEYSSPDVQEEFPAWQYSNPDDGRSRPTHAARNGRYYPASTSFAEVRGTDIGDIAQCRCTFIPIHKSEWSDLRKRGTSFHRFGECKPGERSDLTGCTPAGGKAGGKEISQKAHVAKQVNQLIDSEAAAQAQWEADLLQGRAHRPQPKADQKQWAQLWNQLPGDAHMGRSLIHEDIAAKHLGGDRWLVNDSGFIHTRSEAATRLLLGGEIPGFDPPNPQRNLQKITQARQLEREFPQTKEELAQLALTPDLRLVPPGSEPKTLPLKGSRAAELLWDSLPPEIEKPREINGEKFIARRLNGAFALIKRRGESARLVSAAKARVYSERTPADRHVTSWDADGVYYESEQGPGFMLWSAFGEGSPWVFAGFTGTKKDSLGRTYYYQDGKRVAAPKTPPSAPKTAPAKLAPKPTKPTVDQVHGEISALLASGKRLDVRHVRKVAESLKTLTVAQLKEVRARLNIQATGTKAVLAQQIAEKAIASVKAKQAAPAKPAPAKPTPAAKSAPQPPALPAPALVPKGDTVSKNGQPAGSSGNKALPDHARPKLTSAEADAVETYTGQDYAALNASLRNTGMVTNPYLAKVHAGLQSALAKAETFPAPVGVVRGMNLQPGQLPGFLKMMEDARQSGSMVRLPGYTSTTTGAVPPGFTGNVEVRIQATHGLDVAPYSTNQAERELLLDHNSGFRVDRVTTGPDGKHLIYMTQLAKGG